MSNVTSELAEQLTERLNALVSHTPEIEFAFVFSMAGEIIAQSQFWDNPLDLKAISPALAEMTVTSLELVQKLPLKQPPTKEPIFEHMIVLTGSDGYVVLMPINQHFWITSVIHHMAMLGPVFLDTFGTVHDLAPMLAMIYPSERSIRYTCLRLKRVESERG